MKLGQFTKLQIAEADLLEKIKECDWMQNEKLLVEIHEIGE